jgi:hypothetical protein
MNLTAPPVNTTITTGQLALLKATGADAQPHSGRTLMAHLLGTHALLREWQAPDRVCLAALFHSIYGTNAFNHHSLQREERAKLAACIGDAAEQLAYIFCSVDRPRALIDGINGTPVLHRLTGEIIDLPRLMLADLLCIECANLIEQGGRSLSLSDLFCVVVTDRALLPPAAYTALKAHLSQPVVKKQTHAEAVL